MDGGAGGLTGSEYGKPRPPKVAAPEPSRKGKHGCLDHSPVFSEFLTILSIKLLIILCLLTRKPFPIYTWYVQYLDYSWIFPCKHMPMTTKTIHISLPDPLKEYMDERVTEGNYSTLSDYVRVLVREDQKRHAKERLEKLLIEGLESGRGAEYGY